MLNHITIGTLAQKFNGRVLQFISISLYCYGRKSKVHPTKGHEGPDGEWRYSSTLFLTSAPDRGECLRPRHRYFSPGNDLVPIVQGAGWVPRPVGTGAENLDRTGIQSPAHPARSESVKKEKGAKKQTYQIRPTKFKTTKTVATTRNDRERRQNTEQALAYNHFKRRHSGHPKQEMRCM